MGTDGNRRLVVLSPHLDDAALSVGAAIASASEVGIPVTVLTVFAGDPASAVPAGTWDRLCGYATLGEAARSRRLEDERACGILAAEPVWLPFAYADGEDRGEDAIWAAVAPYIAEAGLVLIPGYPLVHPDHAWLAGLVARRTPAPSELCFYVEQPYANLAVIGRGYAARPVVAAAALALRTQLGRRLQHPSEEAAGLLGAAIEWSAARAARRHRRRKFEAIKAYGSQVRWLGRRLLPRIRLYEWGWGGEGIGLPSPRTRTRRAGQSIPVCELHDLVGRGGTVPS